jgi:hypothetical protein
MNLVELITIENPGLFSGLNEDNARKYNKVELTTKPVLKNYVKTPFENALKEETVYGDHNIPSEEVTRTKKLGDMHFTITVKPTTKRPEYKEVVMQLTEFLDFLSEQYAKGISRQSIRTIDDVPYIGLNDVLDKLTGMKEDALEGKQGVSFRIAYVELQPLSLPTKFAYRPGQNYGELTPNNAIDYVVADYFHAAADLFGKQFEQSIKDLSQYNKLNIPSSVQSELRQIGDFIYPLDSKPTSAMSYGKIINALAKPFDKKITKTTGDLIKIRELAASGELDTDLKATYNPKMRDGEIYISLVGLQDRIDGLIAENTEHTIEQSVKKPYYVG